MDETTALREFRATLTEPDDLARQRSRRALLAAPRRPGPAWVPRRPLVVAAACAGAMAIGAAGVTLVEYRTQVFPLSLKVIPPGLTGLHVDLEHGLIRMLYTNDSGLMTAFSGSGWSWLRCTTLASAPGEPTTTTVQGTRRASGCW